MLEWPGRGRQAGKFRRRRQASRSLALLLALVASAAPLGATTSEAAPTAKEKAKAAGATAPQRPASGPLKAPKTSTVQDVRYFTDLAQADTNLASYMQSRGNVALRALLTDGSAFCAFLKMGGGIDDAMAAVVVGARTVEAQTQLPSTVATFNAIDAVALLALCPDEQRLVPAADRAKVRRLGQALNDRSS